MEATLNLICDCECGPKEEDYTAGPDLFPCTSVPNRIPQDWVFDGEDDCEGGEDETGALERETSHVMHEEDHVMKRIMI